MSTILDALRKVEEDQRTRSADARARLLSFPTRPDLKFSRQKRTPWFVFASLVLAGFAAGAGLILWGPRSRTPEEGQLAREANSDPSADKGLKPLVQPLVHPPGAIAETPPAPAEAASGTQIAMPKLPSFTPPVPPPTETVPAAPTPMPRARHFIPPAQVPAATPPAAPTAAPKAQGIVPLPPTPAEKPSVPAAPWGVAPTSPTPSTPAASPPQSLPPAVEQLLAQKVPQLSTATEQALAARAARRERRSFAAPAAQQKELEKELGAAAKSARSASQPSPKAQGGTVVDEEASTPRVAARTSKPPAAPPNSSLSFLQWSPESDKRMAFIKINGGPLTLAHEGDTVGGYTVVEIRRDAVELRSQGRSFMLQAEE